MLGKTHRRIAKEIAKELSLGERDAGLLEAGSVNPDSWINFPHHYGKEKEIMTNILEARGLFLQGDDECYYRLGIALHYIQDKWTLRPRIGDKHTKWERNIERVPILNDSDFMKMIKQAPLPTKAEQAYLAFLEKISKGVESIKEMKIEDIYAMPYTPTKKHGKVYPILKGPYFETRCFRGLGLKTVTFALQERPTTWSNPVLDINFSYRISLEVAHRVFSREHDEGEWYDANAERLAMEAKWQDMESAPITAKEQQRIGVIKGLLGISGFFLIFASMFVMFIGFLHATSPYGDWSIFGWGFICFVLSIGLLFLAKV